MYAAITSNILIKMCSIGLRVHFKSENMINEIISPMAIAPKSSFAISTGKLKSDVSFTTFFIQTKTATPVPSLNSDSPSITVETFFESPAFLSMEVAAIGSVGETIQPSKIHIHMENPSFNPKFTR